MYLYINYSIFSIAFSIFVIISNLILEFAFNSMFYTFIFF